MNVKFLLTLCLLILSPRTWAQNLSPDAWANLLRSGHERLAAASTDTERLSLHDSLLTWWGDALEAGLGQHPALSLLEGKLALPTAGRGNEWVRVISWNVELTDRTQRYGGFILAADGKGQIQITPLQQPRRAKAWTPSGRVQPDDWPGAIYYDVILTHHRKTPYYTLLGWDGADALVTQKIVEPLQIKRGRVRFGDRTLIGPDGNTSRFILTYADDAVVALRHEPASKRIVMDHLSPFEPHLKGVPSFYGPDMSYDALVWRKGHWLYEPDVEVADPNIKAPYNAPPSSRRRRG